ncbi:MAG TPA: NFACT family protein [Nitrospirota bacterium]|nr:NFACT family protein [Nitrospirota bacterium]
MDFQLLSTVIDELSGLLPGARVQRVYDSEGKEIVLVLRGNARTFLLILSPNRSQPRLHLVTRKPPAAPVQHPFSQFLKSRITAGRVVSAALLNRDRIAAIRFSRQGRVHVLLFELMGPSSNLIVTDETGAVLATYYQTSLSNQSVRLLVPGARYVFPEKKVSQPGKGGSPDLPGDAAQPGEEGQANRMAELHYDHVLGLKRLADARSLLVSAIKKQQRKTARRLEALLQDDAAARNAEGHKEAGDLILANLHALKTGMYEAELAGLDGQLVRITLNPERSPIANAEQYFKRYKKAKAAQKIIDSRLRATRDEAALLRELCDEAEQAKTEQDLAPVRSRLAEQGFGGTPRGGQQRKRPGAPAVPFRRVVFEGWEILIGKSAAGNDQLTTRLAMPDDIWLHAEGLPGSHVVIRNPRKDPLPPDVLTRAASLAAFYSKGRSSGKVSVTYTLARHVKKPRGAKKGLVTLSARRSIMAVPAKEN